MAGSYHLLTNTGIQYSVCCIRLAVLKTKLQMSTHYRGAAWELINFKAVFNHETVMNVSSTIRERLYKY